jgi:hypothetical protein
MRAFPLEPFDLPNARFQVASRIGKLPLDLGEEFGGATFRRRHIKTTLLRPNRS